ncbi:MAG: hypothetical protein JNK15_10620 [Planctomycetes bacterium]|nr:hypothetical protein [Planctomycetota bacterium]
MVHRTLAVPFLFACLASVADAQQIIAQNQGLTSPAVLETFGANVLANFSPVSTQFAPLTISHAAYFTTGSVNNMVGGFLTNDFTAGLPNTLRIQFGAPITDVSFAYHQISTIGPSTIRAMLGGVTVDSFSGTWNQTQPNNWFGFMNTLCDEIQIDFQSDFNVDSLAWNPAGSNSAVCQSWNGNGINPAAFTCTTLPVLGTTWQGAVATTPNTLLTALFYAPGGTAAPVPLFGGELLVSLAPSPTGFVGGPSYSFAVPAAPTWVGASIVFQGMRLESSASGLVIELLNAQQLIIGL